MRPLSRRELIDSSKASLATLFDTAASRMPSQGAPLPSLSRAAMISSTFKSVSSGSLGGSSLPERSEEHTSELQSRLHLVCRLLLEKKKKKLRKTQRYMHHTI